MKLSQLFENAPKVEKFIDRDRLLDRWQEIDSTRPNSLVGSGGGSRRVNFDIPAAGPALIKYFPTHYISLNAVKTKLNEPIWVKAYQFLDNATVEWRDLDNTEEGYDQALTYFKELEAKYPEGAKFEGDDD